MTAPARTQHRQQDPARLRVDVHSLDQDVVILLTGDLVDAGLEDLRAALLAPWPSGRETVLLETSGVGRVEEPGLALLVAAAAWAELEGGTLAYATVSPALRTAARRAGLSEVFTAVA